MTKQIQIGDKAVIIRPDVSDFVGEVEVIEIDGHQARIDDGNDSYWVPLGALKAAQ